MDANSAPLMPTEATEALGSSDRQRTFARYFTGALIDLVILGLFNEYSDKVHVYDFTTLVLASILLQFLLKWTIIAEHYVLGFFSGRSGFAWKLFLNFRAGHFFPVAMRDFTQAIAFLDRQTVWGCEDARCLNGA